MPHRPKPAHRPERVLGIPIPFSGFGLQGSPRVLLARDPNLSLPNLAKGTGLTPPENPEKQAQINSGWLLVSTRTVNYQNQSLAWRPSSPLRQFIAIPLVACAVSSGKSAEKISRDIVYE